MMLAATLALGLALAVSPTVAQNRGEKPIVLDESYQHDRFQTLPRDQMRDFRAFTVSFDGPDDDDGDGIGDVWGVPNWVAQEVRSYDGDCIPTGRRPKWFTDDTLHAENLAPDDATYRYSREFRKGRRNWFDRGHLAMKFLAARMGPEAEWNTHTVLNAVPQRHRFNAGIWLDIEFNTGAWAQEYGAVWVVAGPVFADKKPFTHIGEAGELPVAVPDAVFRIVIRLKPGETYPQADDVLALMYPQVGVDHPRAPFDHSAFLTSVQDLEKRTGYDFLSALPDDLERQVEKKAQTDIWPISPQYFVPPCRKE